MVDGCYGIFGISMELEYTSIETKSGVTGYVQVGNHQQALILVVGYSGTIYHWNRDFVYELAKHYSVYLIDNRFVGLSSSTNPETLDGLAADIIDFIEVKKLDKPILAGWSFGGVCVSEVLKIRPGIAKCAALFGSVPHPSYISKEFYALTASEGKIDATEFRHEMYYLFFSRPFTEAAKTKLAQNSLPLKDYPYRFTSEARKLQDSVVEFWLKRPIDKERIALIQTPVLIIWAKDDLVMTEAAVDIWGKYLPHMQKIIYADGGHFLLHERGVEVAQDIYKFAVIARV